MIVHVVDVIPLGVLRKRGRGRGGERERGGGRGGERGEERRDRERGREGESLWYMYQYLK